MEPTTTHVDITAEIEDFKKELDGASDRAAAVVAGAVFDEILHELLLAAMVKDTSSEKELFSGSGALATFSAKIEVAFRMGLISKGERKHLTLIRRVRNDFAHRLSGVSFAASPVKERIRELEIPIEMARPALNIVRNESDPSLIPALLKADSNDFRGVFSETVLSLHYSLLARLLEIKIHQIESPADFLAAHEPVQLFVTTANKLIAKLDSDLENYNKEMHDLKVQLELLCKELPLDSRVKKIADSIADLNSNNRERLDKIDYLRTRIKLQDQWIAQIKAAHDAKKES